MQILVDEQKRCNKMASDLQDRSNIILESSDESAQSLLAQQQTSRNENLNDVKTQLEAMSCDLDWLADFVHNFTKQQDSIHSNIRSIQSKAVSKPAAICDDAEILTQSGRLAGLTEDIHSTNEQLSSLENSVKESLSKFNSKVPKCDVNSALKELKQTFARYDLS